MIEKAKYKKLRQIKTSLNRRQLCQNPSPILTTREAVRQTYLDSLSPTRAERKIIKKLMLPLTRTTRSPPSTTTGTLILLLLSTLRLLLLLLPPTVFLILPLVTTRTVRDPDHHSLEAEPCLGDALLQMSAPIVAKSGPLL